MQKYTNQLKSKDAPNHSIFFRAMLTFFNVFALAHLGQNLTDLDLRTSVAKYKTSLVTIEKQPPPNGCPVMWKFYLKDGLTSAGVARQ
jgi:hypothetical protein